MDYLEHTISYKVPTDKADDLLAFDGSITIYRVGGELSARCDLESNNVLTLNLANDIVASDKSIEAARKEFGEAVQKRTLGQPPANTMSLQFQPGEASATAELDTITLAGTPVRSGTSGVQESGDAEILAKMMTVDENEIHAATDAMTRNPSPAVKAYAKMLHEQHGQHHAKAAELGVKIGVTPVETPTVIELQKQGAKSLAQVVPLDGAAFDKAFAAMMVQGHSDALKMLQEASASAENAQLKTLIGETQASVASHLEQAKKLP